MRGLVWLCSLAAAAAQNLGSTSTTRWSRPVPVSGCRDFVPESTCATLHTCRDSSTGRTFGCCAPTNCEERRRVDSNGDAYMLLEGPHCKCMPTADRVQNTMGGGGGDNSSGFFGLVAFLLVAGCAVPALKNARQMRARRMAPPVSDGDEQWTTMNIPIRGKARFNYLGADTAPANPLHRGQSRSRSGSRDGEPEPEPEPEGRAAPLLVEAVAVEAVEVVQAEEADAIAVTVAVVPGES